MFLLPAILPFKRKSRPLQQLISGLLVTTTQLGSMSYSQAAEIEEILVRESAGNAYRLEQSSLSKYTEALRDTPQSITTITGQELDDRAAMSLTDALRNVPGITLGAGEFSWQGNSPNIRGFSSRNDMFLDGMRDFGSYDRDPFNLESIEVLLGPSSMVFGRGSTGGVINQTSKQALPDPLRSLHVNVGNADTQRAELDVNQPLSSTAAIRVNLLKHESGLAGRDSGAADRVGMAATLSMELGSATELALSYMQQDSDNIPDYGLPWLAGKPAAVPQENFYGFESDFIDTKANISTIKLDHELTSSMQLQAQLRYADYARSSRITEPLLLGNVSASTPLDSVTVRRNVFRGDSTERMLQGQVNLIARVMAGNLEHALVAGLEAGTESSAPGFGFGLGVPNTSLLHPVKEAFSSSGIAWRVLSDSDADSQAVYVLDTIELNEHWQLMAGLRWDSFDIDYRASRFDDSGALLSNERIARTDVETSWRAALVYKPTEAGTIYLGVGSSFNPSSEGLSFINSGRNLTIGDAYLDPELNRSVELGTKWELLHGAIFVDAALFRITKNNARVPDPANPGFNILAGEQSVDGLSLSMSGRLSQDVSINASYTRLDSEQGQTTQATVLPGTPLSNVPDNSFALWLTWAPVDRVQVAGGARFVDKRLATIAQPVKSVDAYQVFDAMFKYQHSDNLAFKLNLSNITDEYYFEQLHPWHVIPGPGMTTVFAINLDY